MHVVYGTGLIKNSFANLKPFYGAFFVEETEKGTIAEMCNK